MAAPLSQDLRGRLVRAVDAGASAREAAARFEVSASAAIKLVRRVRETGSTAPARIGGYRKPLLADHEALLRELTAAKRDWQEFRVWAKLGCKESSDAPPQTACRRSRAEGHIPRYRPWCGRRGPGCLRGWPLGAEIPGHRPELATCLVGSDPVLRLSWRGAPDPLHDQRDRGLECQAAPGRRHAAISRPTMQP